MLLKLLLILNLNLLVAACGHTTSSHGSSQLNGYWVWEKRVEGTADQTGNIDKGQMKMAFSSDKSKCHYLWNEVTGSDFHTECKFIVKGDLLVLEAAKGIDASTSGYSCAHPDWTSWNDRPNIQYSRFKIVGDRLWLGVNTYWGFGGGVKDVPQNGSLKRFPFWESQTQAETLVSWIVFKPVSKADWFLKYAISTNCQGSADKCDKLKGCGAGEKPYIE